MPGHDVFLSHSAWDKEMARRLKTDLEVYGYTVWLDESELVVGSSLSPAIQAAIRGCRFLAALYSVNTIESVWVGRERRLAADAGIPVIPIALDAADPALIDSGSFYVDLTRPDDQHAYHRAFHDLLRRLGAPTEVPSRLQVYSDGLCRGWLNSSWQASCRERVSYDGRSVAFRAELRPFGGIAFVFRSGISTAPFSSLRFSLHGGDPGGHKMKVFVNDRIGNGIRNPVALDPLPSGQWCDYTLSLEELDAENTIIFKVNWSHEQDELSGPLHLADVEFVSGS
ncbi:toll/interleukin-1 receptor domain-containing protein [Cryptosporangium sp. NPDC051539]|uniref:toll/interleukin-1 receptor domain-containing protein n=1 Tax=Cryptosporangium sp. NPDC051539 TaxID=3363962 RepID=UPI003791AC08